MPPATALTQRSPVRQRRAAPARLSSVLVRLGWRGRSHELPAAKPRTTSAFQRVEAGPYWFLGDAISLVAMDAWSASPALAGARTGYSCPTEGYLSESWPGIGRPVIPR